MKLRVLSLIALLGALLSSNVFAAIDRFTATSAASGVLGYLDYDSSVFDGTSFQYVANDKLLGINFTNPITLASVVTVGPLTDFTIFDSTGLLPTVVGGAGYTGGTDSTNGVWIAQTNFVLLAGTSFSDVSWSTSVVTASAVPEPETYAMMLAGLGLMGAVARRRKGKQA